VIIFNCKIVTLFVLAQLIPTYDLFWQRSVPYLVRVAFLPSLLIRMRPDWTFYNVDHYQRDKSWVDICLEKLFENHYL
jgi:hypothetical protein